MAVYVDKARNPLGRMIMCHMFADSTDELVSMAARIGVNPRWIQKKGDPKEHFDISRGKRKVAMNAGAREIDGPSVVELLNGRRAKKERAVKRLSHERVGLKAD